MNRQALEKLVEVLKNVPEDQFEMEDWTCGTSACAVGHAARDAWFNANGFKLEENGAVDGYHPKYLGHIGYYACEHFFELTHKQALWLFCDGFYIGRRSHEIRPDDVIERVQRLLGRDAET